VIRPIERLENDCLAVFLFHGVVEKSSYQIRNYTRKHLPKDTFAGVIRELCSWGYPLSMEEAVWHQQNHKPFPSRAFAVTFDDGFENNYTIAAPILAEANVPAVFYVTTDFIENNAMSWIDRIEYCLEIASAGELKLPWSEEIHCFLTQTDKIRLLEEIRLNVKNDASIDVVSLVASIFDQCHIEPVVQSRDPLDKKMSWQQVRELHETSDFIVGGHTHTHAVMSFLSPDDLEFEIATSIRLLQDRAGVVPRHYSYPEGLAHCYSPEVIEALKNHGIICCPTAIDGVNRLFDDLFELKRIMLA